LAVSQSGAAQISSFQTENAWAARPQADWLPFTRTVTLTIEAGPVLAPALSSHWQTSISDFSTIGREQRLVVLPSDATDVTATITGDLPDWQYDQFLFTNAVADFGWAYRTNQTALRQDINRIDQYASINQDRLCLYRHGVFHFAYQYVGQIGPDPRR
jgi:hypothetical protein